MRTERQAHGFQFEEWFIKEFFNIYYTSQWDIHRDLNPDRTGGPISLKTAGWKGCIYLGDALRQYDIDETFTLIVGFWEKSPHGKKIVKITHSRITAQEWRNLWGTVTRGEIENLDNIIKNRNLNPDEARREAKEYKKIINHKTGIFTLNPKIDSKTQRRLQCSIPFTLFQEKILGKIPTEERDFVLWGREFKPPEFIN